MGTIRWDWIHLTGFFILGYFSKDFSGCIFGFHIPVLQDFLLKLVNVALALAYAFTFNQIFEKYVEKGIVFKILISSFLLLSLFFITLLFLPKFFRVLLFSFIILFTLYSIPKFGLKKFPFVGSSINSLCFALLFIAGCEKVKFPGYSGLFLMLLITFQFVSQLFHELEHKKIDEKFNVHSTASFLGEDATLKLCRSAFLFSIFLAIIFLFVDNVWLTLPISLPSILFSYHFISKLQILSPRELRRSYKKYGLILGCWFLLLNLIKTAIQCVIKR